jgi:hypothetical protein
LIFLIEVTVVTAVTAISRFSLALGPHPAKARSVTDVTLVTLILYVKEEIKKKEENSPFLTDHESPRTLPLMNFRFAVTSVTRVTLHS